MPPFIKQRLNQSDFLLIAANIIPVYGVWFLGWSAREVFIVYALETLITGVFTVIKLLIATFFKKTDLWYNNTVTTKVSGFFFILFFIIHYGLFAAIQTAIFSASAGFSSGSSGLFDFFIHWYRYVNREVLFMLAVFFISWGVRELIPFIVNRDFRHQSMMRIMFQPYGRIFVQQCIVILGSMFLTFGLDKGFILVFALVKIFFEVFLGFDAILNKSMNELEKESGK
jgi:hypothetical protein